MKYDGNDNEYCVEYGEGNFCPIPPYYFVPCFCSNQTSKAIMEYQTHPAETLQQVWHIFWTILPTLIFFAIARVVVQLWPRISHTDSVLRFSIEFLIIGLPTVITVNVANDYVEYFDLAMCFVFLILLQQCWKKARVRMFQMGKRPPMLTLARSAINYLTALCILAIDFDSFPKTFRKTRHYGAGLMDVGIGLFVFAMGTVSKRPVRLTDFVKLLRAVLPLLVLGIARTVVLMIINYHQDEHEYGKHLNAFITLGLTKLFGGLLSGIARNDFQVLLLGLVTMLLHEIGLHLGISDYVMYDFIQRDNFLNSNREGLCSIPGFISIYLLSLYFGVWMQSKEQLDYKEFMHKYLQLVVASLGIWLAVILSIYLLGIARVTCNMGYILWIASLSVSMLSIFMLVFELVLKTLWPVDGVGVYGILPLTTTTHKGGGDAVEQKQMSMMSWKLQSFSTPILVEAVNLNGLTFFLIANIATGGVNIFLKPENRSDFESIIILTLYMLLSTSFVYVLYRLKIRIA